MTLGEKLKEIRKKFGLSQEQLADIINVSRQAITKWENNLGLPDVSNLQELSKVFGLTVDYLLNSDNDLPPLVMRKELDKDKYNSKISSYNNILKTFYPEPWEIFILTKNPKMGKLEGILDLLTGGDYYLIKGVSDLSPYYLVTKDNLKLLVNIKNWVLEVSELPINTNVKKFTTKGNKFINCGKLK
ncbi:MAG: helix-turn-helix domain-containing protein [Bacilli bacterium]